MNDGGKGFLRFASRDLLQEIQAFRPIANPFLDKRSKGALQQLSEDLEGIRKAAGGRDCHWKMSDLWTIPSNGEYEPGNRRGCRDIVACINGTWDVRPIGTNVKKVGNRVLEFCGIASTRVRLFDVSDTTQDIAMWKMEIGDAQSPGCHFHVQVLGEDEKNPFPKSVSVPRLPSIFVTPMGAVEFVLGELFQERWTKAVMEDNGNVKQWTSLQRQRLRYLLDWQRKIVDNALASPWISLKLEKPEAKMFLSE